MADILLEKMFETERWQELLDRATEKEIDLTTIKKLCDPVERIKLYTVIAQDKYNIFPPHIARIPKDTPGEFREVYVNEPRDRIILTLINDCLSEIFSDMIHPQCKSYQKGIGTQRVVKNISDEIVRMNNKGKLGYKIDFTKYFDSVKIEVIDGIFDEIENRLGFNKGTEPVVNLLRRYYHQNVYFDTEGNVCEKYQSLKQGCACAAFLSNVVMYKLDEYMSNKYKIYYRYCDDLVVIDDNTDDVIMEINNIINDYGVTLNPKKVEPLYADKWFKFLGFNIIGRYIDKYTGNIEKTTTNGDLTTLTTTKSIALPGFAPMKYSDARKQFISDQNLVLSEMLKAQSYSELYVLLKLFMRKMIRLPRKTSKCPVWKDAFKGIGAYETLKNMILFHDVVLRGCDGKKDSMEKLTDCLESYKGEDII